MEESMEFMVVDKVCMEVDQEYMYGDIGMLR